MLPTARRWAHIGGGNPWGFSLAIALAGGAGLGPAAAAQVAPTAQAAPVITAAAIAQQLQALGADSLQNRSTPSPALEATARYLAGQFAQLGLEPASMLAAQTKARGEFGVGASGDWGQPNVVTTWFQRYPLPLALDFAQSTVSFRAGPQRVATTLHDAARLAPRGYAALYMPAQPARVSTVMLIAGNQTYDTLLKRDLHDKILLYLAPPATSLSAAGVLGQKHNGQFDEWAPAAQLAEHSQGVVVLVADDSATFAAYVAAQDERPVLRPPSDDHAWGLFVRPEGVPGLPALLAGAGVDLTRLRNDTTPVARVLPGVQIALDLAVLDSTVTARGADTATAPNVVAMLEGSDPALKDEYLLITAHMDQPERAEQDSIAVFRGGDNARGIAALVALAQAFSQAGARPRRSLLFVATSGGTQPGMWGSTALAAGLVGSGQQLGSVSPMLSVAAVINLDFSGRAALASMAAASGALDSVAIDGLQELDLPVAPAWLAAMHPELHLTVVDGGSVFRPTGNPFPLASHRELVLPSLNVRLWPKPSAAGPADAGPGAEQVARVTQLVFQLGQALGNAALRPRWTPAGRQALAAAAAVIQGTPPQP